MGHYSQFEEGCLIVVYLPITDIELMRKKFKHLSLMTFVCAESLIETFHLFCLCCYVIIFYLQFYNGVR